MRNIYKVPIGKTEGKRSFGRPMRRWEDNIRMNLREIGWEIVTGFIWLRLGTNGGLLRTQ
jgi:hypothetical protein